MADYWWLNMAGMLLFLAITPGPNNLILLRAGSGQGTLSRSQALWGIQLGSFLVLLLSWAGVNGLRSFHTEAEIWMDIASRLVLVLLAILLVKGSRPAGIKEEKPTAGLLFFGLLSFQLFNPKSWLLCLAVIAFLPEKTGFQGGVVLLLIFVGVTLFCQLSWLGLGRLLAGLFERHVFLEQGFLWTTALLLVIYAILS